MLNPRATQALLQIQQALQVLAAEAPGLMPSWVFKKKKTQLSSSEWGALFPVRSSGNMSVFVCLSLKTSHDFSPWVFHIILIPRERGQLPLSYSVSDYVLCSQPGSVPEVATVTEQQQQFVQQMLHSLAESSSGVRQRYVIHAF